MKNHKGFSVVEALLILIIVGLLGGTGWYVYHTKNNAKKNNSSAGQSDSSIAKNTNSTQKSKIVDGPQQGWSTYFNYQSGFSIQIPKTVLSGGGANCTQSSYVYDNYGNKIPSASSYRPSSGEVPTTVVEDGVNFFITEAYTYQLTGMTTDDSGHAFFSGCKKAESTSDLVKQFLKSDKSQYPSLSLDIIPLAVVAASNQDEVLSKAKTIVNESSIIIGSMVKNDSGDWQDVKVECSDVNNCGLNYKFYLRYYSSKKKLVYIALGQSAKFMDSSGKIIYDPQIVDSFKLL